MATKYHLKNGKETPRFYKDKDNTKKLLKMDLDSLICLAEIHSKGLKSVLVEFLAAKKLD